MNEGASILVEGEELLLLPQKGLFWSRKETLFVADVHLGKAAAMRRMGSAIPVGTTEETLTRLSDALDATEARRLIVLGDLLHARAGRQQRTMEEVARWRSARSGLEILLVPGNHDRGSGRPPAGWDIAIVADPFVDPPFVLRHEPLPSEDGYVLAGHVHPGIALTAETRERIVLPCFHFGSRVALLPAFGAFTGLAAIRPEPGDRVFGIAGDRIIPIPV